MSTIKKIIFIHPGIRFPRMAFTPPLGLLYLISILRQNFPNRFEIKLIEQKLYDLSFEQIEKEVKEFNPDVACFSCLSVEANEMTTIARIVKDFKPNCPIILGGPHATTFYDVVLKNSAIDIAVIGEGECTFSELIKKFLVNKPMNGVKGIALKRNSQVILNSPCLPIEDLDSIPFPAWDLIDFKQYSHQTSMNITVQALPWAAIFTSRGCPFHCAYCHKIFGKRTRFRSPENVVAEIELLTKKYGIKEIHIVDDIFNLDLNRAKKICDLIIEKGIKVKIAFPNGLRGDMMDKELIQKLKKAGCYSIIYAVETASPRLQKLIRKNLDLDKVRETIEVTHKAGIIARGFFMLGFPGETKEEMEATIDYALKAKLSQAYFFSVVIYPRIELMEIAKKTYPNFNFDKYWQNINMFELHYWAKVPFYEKVTNINLSKIQQSAYRRFYLRPRIILRGLFLITFRIRPRFKTIFYALRAIFASVEKLEAVFWKASKVKRK